MTEPTPTGTDASAGAPSLIDAGRLAASLAPGLATATGQSLLDAPELRCRLEAFLEQQMAGEPPVEDSAAVLAFAAEPRAVISAAGAALHVARLRSLVLAADIGAFIEAHGAAARTAALASPAMAEAPELEPGIEALIAAVETDGRACVTAWLDVLPPGPALRLRRWRPIEEEGQPGPIHLREGPEIVRAVTR